MKGKHLNAAGLGREFRHHPQPICYLGTPALKGGFRPHPTPTRLLSPVPPPPAAWPRSGQMARPRPIGSGVYPRGPQHPNSL